MEKILPVGLINDYEKKLIAAALADLDDNISKVRRVLFTVVLSTDNCVIVGRQLYRLVQVVSKFKAK